MSSTNVALNAPPVSRPPWGGDEERRRGRPGQGSVAQAAVVPERLGGGVVQRYLAVFVLLVGADVQRAVGQIDLGAVERERLAPRTNV